MNTKRVFGQLGQVKLGDGLPVRIMGVVNLTTNSFYGGSVKTTKRQLIETVRAMEEAGADIIDIGARSTAPYRQSDIPSLIETKILGDAIRMIRKMTELPLSADTTRIEPAREAAKEGIEILNDAYGLSQKDAFKIAELIAKENLSLILTAHEIRPRTVPKPIQRVKDALVRGLTIARSCGISMRRISTDPGIGFFQDPRVDQLTWNATIISNLEQLRDLNLPICVGISRKRFIGKALRDVPVEGRLVGSLSATAIAVYKGAHLIRTHDVKETKEAVLVAQAIRENSLKPEPG